MKKYDAFISYRHLPLDMYVAKTLHKTLESFKLPKNLMAQGKKSKIERVFRDRDELPLSSNLSKSIEEALRESEYLVVICTPKLKESEWCIREIETFKKMYGQQNIFAVLAEGEPEESLPTQLLTEEYEETDEFGNTVVKVRNVEPLAADVRGNNKAQIKKKIKEESLRLAAPIFGVAYDDLKQRHRERRLKKMLSIASVVSLVLLIFGIISTSMAITIRRQSKIVNEGYSIALANEALDKLSEGDVDEALRLSDESIKLQDNATTQNAKNMVLATYAPGGILVNTDVIRLDTGVLGMFASNDASKVIISDNNGRLLAYDTKTEEIKELQEAGKSYCQMGNAAFVDNDRLICDSGNEVLLIDVNSGEAKSIVSEYSGITVDAESNSLCLTSSGDFKVFNLDSMDMRFEVSIPCSLGCKCAVTYDGQKMLVVDDTDVFNNGFTVVDANDGNTVVSGAKLGGAVVSVTGGEGCFYLAVTDMNETSDVTHSYVAKISAESGDIVWKSDISKVMFANVDYVGQEGKGYVYALTPVGPVTYDADTGMRIAEASPTTMSVVSGRLADAGRQYVVTLDGQILYYDVVTGACDKLNDYYVEPSLKVSNALITEDSAYIWYQGTGYVSVYHSYAGSADTGDIQTSIDPEEYLNATTTDEFISYKDTVYDLYGAGEIANIPQDEMYSVIIRSADEKYYMCYNAMEDNVRIFEASTGNKLSTIDAKIGMICCVFFSTDNKYACISFQNGDLEIYDMTTFEQVATLSKDYLAITKMYPLEDGSYAIAGPMRTEVFDAGFEKVMSIETTSRYECIGYSIPNQSFVVKSNDNIEFVPYKKQ